MLRRAGRKARVTRSIEASHNCRGAAVTEVVLNDTQRTFPGFQAITADHAYSRGCANVTGYVHGWRGSLGLG